MLELMDKGGVVMWIIYVLFVSGFILFWARLFHIHRAKINHVDFLEGIYVVLRRNSIVEAVTICDETPGPVAHLTRAAILQRDQDREQIKKAIEEAGLAELPRLERGMLILLTLAQTLPILGLLGTVVGLMDILTEIQQKAPLIHSGDLAAGMWQALTTTGAGLSAAAILYIGYNILVTRVEVIVLDMELASAKILGFLTHKDNKHERTP